MKTYFDIPYTKMGLEMQRLDVYLPEQEEFDLLIWFHGGGLEAGNRKGCSYAEAFVKRGIAFVSVEYRMYPTAHFPEFIEDAAASVAWVIRNKVQLKGCRRIFVSGESAGAYLTMMLCMDHRYLEAAGVSQHEIAGYISDSAQQFCHFNVLREFGMDKRLERIDERAPIFFVKQGLELRPLCLIYYQDDMKCRPEETKLMYASLKNICPENDVRLVEYPGRHCSKPKNEDGELMFVETVCDMIRGELFGQQ